MTEPTILALDQGTTSTRAILFSKDGAVLGTAQKQLPQHYPQKSWVEHNPEDIWQDTLTVCREIFKNHAESKNCTVMGITNQRETTIVWDRKTGKPVYNAIVWQDRRTADFCASLKEKNVEQMITEKTGLLIDPYFSCTKIHWILENVDGARTRAENGELAFGTVDCFLLWRLTNGKIHATDATNASRTGLFNIITQEWDDALLSLYDIPRSLLPEVKDNIADFGMVDPAHFGSELTIGGMAGDQHAALIGQGCLKPSMMKSTYGTGCFALMHIGDEFRVSANRLLTTLAYRINGKSSYAIEGSIFVAGAAVQWLRDNLGLISSSDESEILSNSVDDNNGVYFVPAFTGLGAPYWRPDARAMISGMTRDTTKAHIVRAALESQAYQTLDLLNAMQMDTNIFPQVLRVDGGLVRNGFVCQFLSDMLQIPIELPDTTETTALGAAYLAGVQAGIYTDLQDAAQHWQCSKRYTPKMSPADQQALYSEWKKNLSFFLTR